MQPRLAQDLVFFGIAVSKVRLRCCVRESIYLGMSSFPRLVGSSLLSRHNPLIAFWKPEQQFLKKSVCGGKGCRGTCPGAQPRYIINLALAALAGCRGGLDGLAPDSCQVPAVCP